MAPSAFYSHSLESGELIFEEDKDENKTSLGIHFGIRVNFGPIGLDIRYEKGFSAIEKELLTQKGVPTVGQIDTRPNQFTLGISFKLN